MRSMRGPTACKVTQLSLLRDTTAPDLSLRQQASRPQEGKCHAPLTTEPSCKDEMRVGQKNGLVYQGAKKGTRPRQLKDQRYANASVFGAVCPARDAGAALPRADTEAMQKHLAEISLNVAAGVTTGGAKMPSTTV